MDVKSEDERDPPPNDIHDLSERMESLKCSPRSLRCPSLNHDGAGGTAGGAAVDGTHNGSKIISHFFPKSDTPIPQVIFTKVSKKSQPVDSTNLEDSSNADTDTSESSRSVQSDAGNQPSSRLNKTRMCSITAVFGDVKETYLCVSKSPYQEFLMGNDSGVDLRAAAGVGVKHATNLDSIFRPNKRLKASSGEDTKKSGSSATAKSPPPAPCKPKK